MRGKWGEDPAGASGPGLGPRKTPPVMPAPSWYVKLPIHETRTPRAQVRASAQATGHSEAGGGWALSDSGRALSRCPCLQSSR